MHNICVFTTANNNIFDPSYTFRLGGMKKSTYKLNLFYFMYFFLQNWPNSARFLERLHLHLSRHKDIIILLQVSLNIPPVSIKQPNFHV